MKLSARVPKTTGSSKFRILMTGVIALFVPGCISVPGYLYYSTIIPTASDSTKIDVHEDTTVVTSNQTNGVVIKLVQPTFGTDHPWYPTLFIGILNRTSQPILFSTKNIRITSGVKKAYFYTPEQMEANVEHAALEAENELDMMAADAMANGDEPLITNGRGSAPLPSEAYERRQELIRIAFDQEPSDILAANQVMPGKFAGGLVGVKPGDIDPKQPLVILVRLPGEVHKFSFHIQQNW